MSTLLFFILLAVFLLGLTLFLLARRGRKLNNHPQCVHCGFDVAGTWPASPTCPECGAGLKRAGALRQGVRRRMPVLMALGVVIALVPLAPLAVFVYAAATGTNLSKYTPTGLLLLQTRFASPTVNRQIAAELVDRLMLKKLDKDQTAAVAARALEIQADKNIPWEEAWGDVIARLDLNGALSKQDKARYHTQAANLTIDSRAAARPGDTLYLVVKCDDLRIDPNASMMLSGAVSKITLNGKPVTRKNRVTLPPGRMFPSMRDSIDVPEFYFNLAGTKARSNWGMLDEMNVFPLPVQIPDDTPPGTYTLSADLTTQAFDRSGGWAGGGSVKPGAPGTITTTLTRTVTIRPATDPLIATYTPTQTQREKLTDLLKNARLNTHYHAQPGLFLIGASVTRDVALTVTLDDNTTPFAFDVFVRLRDKEAKIGILTSSKSMAGDRYDAYRYRYFDQGGKDVRTVGGNVPTLKKDDTTFDLIFRPSTQAALTTSDLTGIYGEEITIKGMKSTPDDR